MYDQSYFKDRALIAADQLETERKMWDMLDLEKESMVESPKVQLFKRKRKLVKSQPRLCYSM